MMILYKEWQRQSVIDFDMRSLSFHVIKFKHCLVTIDNMRSVIKLIINECVKTIILNTDTEY